MTPPGRDKNIDSILELFDTKIYVTTGEVAGKVGASERDNSINQMLAIGLIQPLTNLIVDDPPAYILTAFGIEVKRSGSWTKYLSDKDDDKIADRELVKASTRANNLNLILLIATGLFSLSSVILSIVDIRIHRKELRVAKEELRLHKLELQKLQLDTATNLHQEKKSIRQANPKADSLQ
jgi:hypothetical protein